jgi:hypothetical protein
MIKEKFVTQKAQWKKRMRGQAPIKLTQFHKEILRDCIIRGKMTIKHVDKYYINRASSSLALRRLLEAGIIEEGTKKYEYAVKQKYQDCDAIWLE